MKTNQATNVTRFLIRGMLFLSRRLDPTGHISEIRIDHDQPAGLYFIRVETGKAAWTGKFAIY